MRKFTKRIVLVLVVSILTVGMCLQASATGNKAKQPAIDYPDVNITVLPTRHSDLRSVGDGANSNIYNVRIINWAK